MKILFIDNDKAICELFKTTLENRYKAQVVVANQGADVKKILRDISDINIIVCDYIMPDIHGADLYRFIRENYPEMVFILQTSNLQILKTDTRFYDFFEDIYLNRAISRPFTPSELFWVIGDSPIVKQIPTNESIRKEERCNIIIDAFILSKTLENKHHVRSLNVNKGGMFLMCDLDLLEIGDIISYEMSVDFFNASGRKAIVRWKREGNLEDRPTGVGVEYI